MDMYHIQISVYVEGDIKTNAKLVAQILKENIEYLYRNCNDPKLDEVVIDSVGIEKTRFTMRETWNLPKPHDK